MAGGPVGRSTDASQPRQVVYSGANLQRSELLERNVAKARALGIAVPPPGAAVEERWRERDREDGRSSRKGGSK